MHTYKEFHRRNSPRRFYFGAMTTGMQATGLSSPTGRLSKDGASFANCTNLPVSVGDGLYYIDLTATETDAEKLIFTFNTLTTDIAKMYIFSDSNFEASRVNLIGSTIGSGTVNITNAATGNRTIDVVGSGELIRLRTTPHALSDTIAFTSTLSNNFINMDGASNAGVLIKNSFIGMDIFNNTIGVRLQQNNQAFLLSHRHLTTPAVVISCPTGASYDMIQIINPSTGRYSAVAISCPSTGGGDAVKLSVGHSGSYGLSINNTHPTGFGIYIGGILPEPTMPFNKDTLSLMDSISFMTAMMSNKRVLNKDTATDTLYLRDGTTNMYTRSVSDDGTSQTVNATD